MIHVIKKTITPKCNFPRTNLEMTTGQTISIGNNANRKKLIQSNMLSSFVGELKIYQIA